jgi:hypothetical protein
MAERIPRDRSEEKVEPEIASADWLLGQDPAADSPKPAVKPAVAPRTGEVFDLVETPSSVDATPSGRGTRTADPPREAARPTTEKTRSEPEPLVEQVWSRGAEWGPTLLILAIWLLGLAIFVYFTLGLELYGISFLALILGGLVACVLSYPILITLERPVRVTPEQAVRDFYTALSHHFPHYRRMWLLLSTPGRISWAYASFEGFKSYWADRLRQLRGTHAGPMTPLVFEVVDYRGDKSAGRSRIDAQFTVKVSVRGHRQAGPIGSFPMQIALVRGPDKMWYLENGTLSDSASAKS